MGDTAPCLLWGAAGQEHILLCSRTLAQWAEPQEAGAALDVHARAVLPALCDAHTIARAAPHTVGPRLPSWCTCCAGAGVGLVALSIARVLAPAVRSRSQMISRFRPWHRLLLGHQDYGQTVVWHQPLGHGEVLLVPEATLQPTPSLLSLEGAWSNRRLSPSI